jgi:phosphoenolpyruvate carboxykinase (GTP)
LRDDGGNFLNGIKDKHVWIKWMELRVNGEAEAIKTPTGYIPGYEDLRRLFQEVLGKKFTRYQYAEQFKLRIPESLAKIERIKEIYHSKVFDTPHSLFKALDDQKARLEACQAKHGDYVAPTTLEKDQN